MRHFLLLAVSIGHLAGGVVELALWGCLVAPAGAPQCLAALDLGADFGTVDVASVTARADSYLLVAVGAVEKTISVLDHLSPPAERLDKRGAVGHSRDGFHRVLDHRDNP